MTARKILIRKLKTAHLITTIGKMFFDQLAISTICYPLEEQNIKHVGVQTRPQQSLSCFVVPSRALISCGFSVKAERTAGGGLPGLGVVAGGVILL